MSAAAQEGSGTTRITASAAAQSIFNQIPARWLQGLLQYTLPGGWIPDDVVAKRGGGSRAAIAAASKAEENEFTHDSEWVSRHDEQRNIKSYGATAYLTGTSSSSSMYQWMQVKVRVYLDIPATGKIKIVHKIRRAMWDHVIEGIKALDPGDAELVCTCEKLHSVILICRERCVYLRVHAEHDSDTPWDDNVEATLYSSDYATEACLVIVDPVLASGKMVREHHTSTRIRQMHWNVESGRATREENYSKMLAFLMASQARLGSASSVRRSSILSQGDGLVEHEIYRHMFPHNQQEPSTLQGIDIYKLLEKKVREAAEVDNI